MKFLRELLLSFMIAPAMISTAAMSEKPNVLFIAVDDLRPQTAAYGKSFMHTPNLDRLANEGVLFERAYCMVATCGASRASLMTGMRPTRSRFYSYKSSAAIDAPEATTLNTWFKQHGYTTISLGKVFHNPEDNEAGWSEPAWLSSKGMYQRLDEVARLVEEDERLNPKRGPFRYGPSTESADEQDDAYPDGEAALKAIDYLQRFAAQPEEPFFLAVGFLKPHLPFVAPQRYWDLYDTKDIGLPENYYPPKDAPAAAVHHSPELRGYTDIPLEGPVSDETALRLIRGYYASVSFVDAQVGRVLDELRRLGLARNTVVVLWGDHGWQLGEHGMWNKHSCFETSMHAPLIVKAPLGTGFEPGTRVRALTEFIDVYPSLCELAGVPAPGHLDGESFVPLMRDPELAGKPFAVGRFGWGDTIRSDDARFSLYTKPNGDYVGSMLYDQGSDPDENINIVDERPDLAIFLAERLGALKGRDEP